MARAIIGDPATLNCEFFNGQAAGVGANFSGITIRVSHEHCPCEVLNASWPMAEPPMSALWSVHCGGVTNTLPPCAGTTTSEHGWFWSQPRNWFSSEVRILDVELAGAVRGGGRVGGVHRAVGSERALHAAVVGPVALGQAGRVRAAALGHHDRVVGGGGVVQRRAARGESGPRHVHHLVHQVAGLVHRHGARVGKRLSARRVPHVRPLRSRARASAGDRGGRARRRRGEQHPRGQGGRPAEGDRLPGPPAPPLRPAAHPGSGPVPAEQAPRPTVWLAVHVRAACRVSRRCCRRVSSPGALPPSARAAANNTTTTTTRVSPAPKARVTTVWLTASTCA